MDKPRHSDGRFAAYAHDEATTILGAEQESDFVLVRHPVSVASDHDIERMRDYICALIPQWEEDIEWMPDVDISDEEYDDEADGYITRMDDLTDPEVSGGQCVRVSEAFQSWMKYRGRRVDVVQGLIRATPALSCHYGNVVRLEGGPPLVVDFTYSQIDESAPFPMICTPQEWVDGIDARIRP